MDLKININNDYIQEGDIDSLIFYFRVKKTLINELNIDITSIFMVRYHNDWQSLKTIFIEENEKYFYYSTESPGCSTFAIVGSEVVEKNEAFKTNEFEITWSFICAFIGIGFVILFVVILKAKFIYIDEKEGHQKKTCKKNRI